MQKVRLITQITRRFGILAAAAFIIAGGLFVSVARADAPNLVVTNPAGGEYWRGAQTIHWTASTTATTMNVLYSTNPSSFLNSVMSGVAVAPSGTTDWNVSGVSDGVYYIQLQAVGTGENVTSAAFNIDNTVPATTFASSTSPDPVTGWYNIATGAPTITLACTDPTVGGVSSGCGATYYAWDGAATSTYSGSITAPEGDHVLSYWSEDNAVDNAGAHNVEAVHTQEFKVDTAAPSVSSYTLDGLSADAYFNPSSTSSIAKITASESVDWMSVRIRNVADPSGTYKSFAPSAVDPMATLIWSGDLSSGTLSDGPYEITYHIKDAAGNETGSVSAGPALTPYRFIVDTAAPLMTLTAPLADAVYKSTSLGGDTTGSNAISFTSSDANALTYTYSVDGTSTSTPAAANNDGLTAVNAAISGLSDGRHTIVVTVMDQAGNKVASTPISIVFDNNNTLTVGNGGGVVGAEDFDTIQEAVDKATAGDTVSVSAGTYQEQVTIAKNLTVTGAGGTTVVQSPNTLATTFNRSGGYPMKPVITIDGATVDISQLQIDGLGKGNSNNRFTGLGLHNAAGTVDHVTVTGIRDNPLSGVQHGYGIYAYNEDATVRTLAITNNTVTDYQKNGINVEGTGLTANISGNTVTGAGATSVIAQNGIVIMNSATGSITGNTVSGHSYTPATVSSTGLMLYNAAGPVTISGNIVHDNDVGVYVLASGGQISLTNNTLTDNATGLDIEAGAPVAVDGGSITGGDEAVYSDNASVTIHHATITANSTLVENANSAAIDATNNYWGTAVYTSINAKMNRNPGDILFDPYYVDAGKTILSNVPVSNVYVDDNYTDGSAGGHYFGYDAFSTVADGVGATALSSGGTVHVYAGTYTENPTINKPLTLNADGGTAAIISGLTTIATSSVTVSGFTLTNPSGNYAVSISGTSDVTITGNTVTDVGTSASGNIHSIIWQDGPSDASNLTITNNTFTNIGNTTTGGSTSAIGVLDSTGTAILTGATITGNTINGVSAKAGKGAYGIIINHATSGIGSVVNALVATNTISSLNGGLWATAIGLEGNTPNAVVSGNTISGLTAPATIGVHIEANTAAGSVKINYNSFDAALGYGIVNSMTTDADGQFNWWGDAAGPYHATKNPAGLGADVSDYVDFSPFCQNNGCTTFVSVDPIKQITLTPSPASVAVPFSSTITILAKDALGYTVVNDTASQFSLTVDHGGSLSGLFATLTADGTTSFTVANHATGATNVGASLLGASPAVTGQTQVTFTPGDTTAPFVTAQHSADGTTGVSITSPNIYLDFSEALEATTTTSANIQLRKYSDDSVVTATVALVEGGTRVTITPAAALDYSTQYYLAVSSAVTDLSYNGVSPELTSATKAAHEFTTEAVPADTTAPSITNVQTSAIGTSTVTITWNTSEGATSRVEYGTTSLYGTGTATTTATTTAHSVTVTGLTSGTLYHFRVVSADDSGNIAHSTDNTVTTAIDDSTAVLQTTGITATQTYATADDTFEHGWHWTFGVTVPTDEQYLSMKFSDFTGTAGSILAANNIRFYSAQSTDAFSTTTAKTIAAANTYPTPPIALSSTADLDPLTPGRQIEVSVEVKVPTTATGGSYGASYGIKTATSTSAF